MFKNSYWHRSKKTNAPKNWGKPRPIKWVQHLYKVFDSPKIQKKKISFKDSIPIIYNRF